MGIHYFFSILLALHFIYLVYRVIRILTRRGKRPGAVRNQVQSLVVLGLAAILISTSWLVTTRALTKSREDNYMYARNHLNEFNLSLSSELAAIDKAVRTMAGSPWIRPALQAPSAANIARADSVLDRYRSHYTASVCYLLDAAGTTVATTNRDTEESFLGQAYDFRSYFLRAREGQFGYYFALGVTSGKRGYYSSAPIQDEQGRFLGAAVIKQEIDFIEQKIVSRPLTGMIDKHGIIFLSSRPGLCFRPLWPVAPPLQAELNDSAQFGQIDFTPLLSSQPENRETIKYNGQLSFLTFMPIDKAGWNLFSITPFTGLLPIQLVSSLLTSFLVLLIHLISVLIVYFRARQTEMVLRESEELYREMLESLPQIIFTCDKEGNITYANEFGIQYFGASREQGGAPPNMLRFINPRDHARARARLEDLVSHQKHMIEEYEFFRENGKTFSGLVHGVPYFRNDQLAGFRGFVVDISRQKEKAEEQNKINKLESIGTLAGGLAHDFNNILTSLNNGIIYLELKFAADNETKKLLTDLGMAISYGKEITQQLLTFSKGGTPVKETTSIAGLIRETADFVLRGSNCQSVYLFKEDLWSAEIDRGQISQVIQNLCLNAIQAMPGGGIITLEAMNKELSAGEYRTVPPGKYLRLRVDDTGTGIAPEILPRIFDPFFTTRNGGTGLGLATVHSIIRKHNGYIFAESVPGKNTCFTIFLPAGARPPVRESAARGELKTSSGRILVMDDDRLVLQTCQKLLEYLGYEVTGVSKGEQALEEYAAAEAAGAPFAAVIMDLTIKGGMGGRETLVELLKIDPQVKAVVSSGYSNDPVMSQYARYGFAGVISKPYRLEKMSLLLKELIGLPEKGAPH